MDCALDTRIFMMMRHKAGSCRERDSEIDSEKESESEGELNAK